MGMGGSSRKNQKCQAPIIKIGEAISGPRITGGNFMDITLFLNVSALRAQQGEICVKFSVFHAVFDVKFW